MFYWRPVSVRRGRSVVVHDRRGRGESGPYSGLNLGGHVGDDPAAVRPTATAVAAAIGLSRPPPVPEPGARHDVAGRRALGRAAPPPPTGSSPRRRGWRWPPWWPTARRSCCRRRRRGRRRCPRGSPRHDLRHRRRRAAHADLGARESVPWSGRRCAAAATRCRPTCVTRRAVSPAAVAVSWTGTLRWTWPPAWSSAHANDVAVQWVPGCAREDEGLYSYRRDGRTGRFAGVVVLDAPDIESARPGSRGAAWRRSRDRAGAGRPGCAEAGRDPAEVTLVVVTKFFPASDVMSWPTSASGHRREPRPGGSAKFVRSATSSRGRRARRTLHFIGQLQCNKAASVAAYADVVQSVDRTKLVAALDGPPRRRPGPGGAAPGEPRRRRHGAWRVLPRATSSSSPMPWRHNAPGPARRHGGRAPGCRPRRGVRAPAGRRDGIRARHPRPTGSPRA